MSKIKIQLYRLGSCGQRSGPMIHFLKTGSRKKDCDSLEFRIAKNVEKMGVPKHSNAYKK